MYPLDIQALERLEPPRGYTVGYSRVIAGWYQGYNDVGNPVTGSLSSPDKVIGELWRHADLRRTL